ncbi:YbgA family protein [Ferrimonas marina]|uniref:Uncharacterized conserved protein YbgA, DUF1722 family n=1 Tax=Ferrimonas marina TaxID=299255 RepID=A0A1M5Z3Q6_9GAMM|nr:DUF523 and DUF1722 domain-containing protein [Ferrimonas marina]SHI18897.1 Uncharacterized conserved protein YbgA, DUF1722 family [Ferrimonas marina]
MSQPKPLVGVSACIIGQPVRFDGGHKRSHFVDDQLSQWVQLKPLCPEVGAGMTVPRPTVRLRKIGESVRIMDDKNNVDYSDAMHAFNERALPGLASLSGYVVCAKSPSCGMERVKVVQEDGKGAERNGRGLFTDALMKRYPLLPVEEDGRLNDPHLRENFVVRVLIYQELQQLMQQPSKAALLAFHQKHKLQILSHNQDGYRQMGRFVASLRNDQVEGAMQEYGQMLMDALKRPASRKGHTNVLQHIQGYFKKDIAGEERQHLHDTILAYRRGRLPLMAPLSIVQHLLTRFPKPYITGQSYLRPHPDSLALRCVL